MTRLTWTHERVGPDMHSFRFESRSTRGEHHELLVDLQEPLSVTCTCPGFAFREFCAHKAWLLQGAGNPLPSVRRSAKRASRLSGKLCVRTDASTSSSSSPLSSLNLRKKKEEEKKKTRAAPAAIAGCA